MKQRVGFIGAGNMAGAIIKGVVKAGSLQPAEIAVYDISPQQLAPYRAEGYVVCSDIAQLVRCCQVVVLAVRPQVFDQVLPQVKAAIEADTVLVSIAAGITGEAIQTAMGFACKVVLAMPNTPLLLGQGAVALARVAPTTQQEFAFVQQLFSCAGVALEISPQQMNAVICVNGSSPAFIYLMADTIVQYAASQGIDPTVATQLFCQTLVGSAQMLLQTGKTPGQLIDMVASPGGTTLAALDAMEQTGYAKSLRQGCLACTHHAREMFAKAQDSQEK